MKLKLKAQIVHLFQLFFLLLTEVTLKRRDGNKSRNNPESSNNNITGDEKCIKVNLSFDLYKW